MCRTAALGRIQERGRTSTCVLKAGYDFHREKEGIIGMRNNINETCRQA